MTYVIIFIIVAFIIHTIINASEKNAPLPKRKFIDITELTFNESNSTEIFNELKNKYLNGDTLTYDESNDYENKIKNLNVDQFSKDLLLELSYKLYDRSNILGLPTNKIILRNNELQYFCSPNAEISKVGTISKNISYCGFRANKNAFKSGNMFLNCTNVTGVRPLGSGQFHVTNQRILFVLNRTGETLEIPIKRIISYTAYEDKGVIFNISNSKSIIIEFPIDGKYHNTFTEDFGIIFNDDKINLLYTLDKIFEKK